MAGEPETAADRPESAIEVTLDVKEVWFDAQEELETDKPEVSAPGEPVGAAQAEAEAPPCADPLAESPAKSSPTSSFGEMVSQGVKMVSQALGADTTDSEAARDAQAQAQARCELVHQKARLDRAAAELAARERALKEREEAVGRREAHVEIRVKQAAEKVQALVPQQAALREWEARVKRAAEQRERDMVGQETALMEWHRDIERRTAEVGVREQQSEAREGEVVRREEQAETREALVAQREVEAAHQHQMVARRAADVEADAAAKADDVTTRALEVQAKSNELEDTKLRLEERHLKLEDDTKALEAARRELSNSAAAAAAAAAAATGGGGALVATGGADVAAAAAPPVVSWPCLMPKLGCVGYHVQQGTTAAAFQKVIDDIGEFANLPAERFVPATVAAGVAPTDGRPTAPLHSYPLVILFIKVRSSSAPHARPIPWQSRIPTRIPCGTHPHTRTHARMACLMPLQVAGSRLSEGVIHADEVARCRAVVAPGGRLLLATINAGHNAGVAKELPADCPRREMIDGLLHFSYVSGCPPKRPHGLSRTSKLTETAMHELGALLPAPPPKYAMTVATAPAAPRPPRAREDSYNCLFPWLNSRCFFPPPHPPSRCLCPPPSSRGSAPGRLRGGQTPPRRRSTRRRGRRRRRRCGRAPRGSACQWRSRSRSSRRRRSEVGACSAVASPAATAAIGSCRTSVPSERLRGFMSVPRRCTFFSSAYRSGQCGLCTLVCVRLTFRLVGV